MTVNLAQKYSGKLDQLFAKGSYTDAAVNQNYEFDGVKRKFERPCIEICTLNPL